MSNYLLCCNHDFFILLITIVIIHHHSPPHSTIDWKAFHKECTAHLPTYARPAFIRISKEMALTSTFKHQKSDLVKDGYDVKGDEVFYYSVKDGSVVPVTPQVVQQINQGVIKL